MTPDPYAAIAEADPSVQEMLAGVIELRAADPRQHEMLASYTSELELDPGSRLVEIGCGTGAISRYLAKMPGVGSVVGVDPGEIFIAKARELADDEKLEFVVGNGTALEFRDGSFDAAVIHTVLCHVPECEKLVAEAHRVVRPGGSLAVFDNDPTTASVAIREDDPLQECVESALAALVNDPWVMRRIEPILTEAGFDDCRIRGHSFIENRASDYMLTIIDRGADFMAADGRLSSQEAEARKAEARRRSEDGTFFGHASYISAIAARP